MNNTQEILFGKLREDVIIPSKRIEDGAFDIYANFEEDYMLINPHNTILIPTGLVSAFSTDYVAKLAERGSTGSKGLGLRAGVIDSGYRGEWFVAITNHNSVPMAIVKEGIDIRPDVVRYPYEKAIAQCIMQKVEQLAIREVSVEEIKSISSERGEGKLGSSTK